VRLFNAGLTKRAKFAASLHTTTISISNHCVYLLTCIDPINARVIISFRNKPFYVESKVAGVTASNWFNNARTCIRSSDVRLGCQIST